MAEIIISLRNLQKVEFKNDPNKCNVSFTDYDPALPGRSLLVTDVPAGAGTMLGSFAAPFLGNPGVNLTTPPTILVDTSGSIVSGGAGPSVDSAKYGGRIEVREF